MARSSDREWTKAKRTMLAALSEGLRSAMGIRHRLVDPLVGDRSPFLLAPIWYLLYCGAAAICFWAVHPGLVRQVGHPELFGLTIWGGFYFAIAMIRSRYTSKRICEIVKRDILPFASDRFAELVEPGLKPQASLKLVYFVPNVAALAGLILAGGALWMEFGLFDPARFPYTLDVWFWIVSFYYFFYTAARAVTMATFTRQFAAALDGDQDRLYLLAAADSPLVRGLATLNRTVLAYWTAMVFVMLSVVAVVLIPEPFALSIHSPFLILLVPIASALSLGVGSLVYWDSESTIRDTLRRFTLRSAKPIQDRINVLLDPPQQERADRVALRKQLSELHDVILAGGRYGSRVGTAVSVAIPLALPAIALAEAMFGNPG